MGMFLIVDGYNVLKRHGSRRTITQEERERFLRLVDRYLSVKRHEAIIVFDGGASLYQTCEKWGNVTVMYAGGGRTADECILELLDRAAKDTHILVSSDRELIMAAEACDIPFLDAETFYGRVHEIVHLATPRGNVFEGGAIKRAGCTSSSEVDALLAGVKVTASKEERGRVEKGHCERISSKERERKSKVERRLEKIARKL